MKQRYKALPLLLALMMMAAVARAQTTQVVIVMQSASLGNDTIELTSVSVGGSRPSSKSDTSSPDINLYPVIITKKIDSGAGIKLFEYLTNGTQIDQLQIGVNYHTTDATTLTINLKNVTVTSYLLTAAKNSQGSSPVEQVALTYRTIRVQEQESAAEPGPPDSVSGRLCYSVDGGDC